jgi:hypothetical protein
MLKDEWNRKYVEQIFKEYWFEGYQIITLSGASASWSGPGGESGRGLHR